MGTFIPIVLSALEAVTIAEPCTATTTLEGPAALTAPIARGLKSHGVTLGSTGTCPGHTVRATVAPSSSPRSFKLHIEDSYGRTSDRLLSEAGTAVSLIESWAVEEDSDLLAATARPSGSTTPTVVATAALPPAAVTAVRLYGGIASAVGSDRSVWGGGLVGGCARFGFSCVGAELYVAHDLGLAGDTADAGTTRSAADLLVTAALPLAKGRFLLMPSLGVGAGWMRTHVAAEDADTPAQTGNTFGLRAAVSVTGGLSISSHVMVALGLGGVLAPTSKPNPQTDVSTSTSSLPEEPRLSGRAVITCMVTP
jgi:hypothetical protein